MSLGGSYLRWNDYNYQQSPSYENLLRQLSCFKDKRSNVQATENSPPSSNQAALTENRNSSTDQRVAHAVFSSAAVAENEGRPGPYRFLTSGDSPKLHQEAPGQAIDQRLASAASSTHVRPARESKEDKLKRLVAEFEANPRNYIKPCDLGLIAEWYYRNGRHSELEGMVKGINLKFIDAYASVFRVHAKSLVHQGRLQEARKVYKDCIELIKNNEWEYNNSMLDWLEMELACLNMGVVKTALAQFTAVFPGIAALRNKFIVTQVQLNAAALSEEVGRNLPLLKARATAPTAIGNLERCIEVLLARGKYQEAVDIYQKIMEDGIPTLSSGDRKGQEKRIILGMADCYLLMQKLFKADACYESLKKSGLLNQGEDDMRECIFLEMGGNAAAALKAIKKSLFASGPGSIPIEKKLECWAFVKFCYRHGLFDELQSHQEAIVPAFPFLTFCFIKARLERGEAPLELIEKYRPLNKNVGPFMCAEALVYLNPCLPHFNLSKARELLLESLKYTHQYGDAWIELARLAMIEHGPDVDLRELEQKFVGRPPNYGELWYFLGGSYPGAPLLQFRCAISKLREEMRPLMPIYNNAKAGRFGPSDQAFLFSAASISYCRTAASGTLASSITRYQQLDLAKAAWGKR